MNHHSSWLLDLGIHILVICFLTNPHLPRERNSRFGHWRTRFCFSPKQISPLKVSSTFLCVWLCLTKNGPLNPVAPVLSRQNPVFWPKPKVCVQTTLVPYRSSSPKSLKNPPAYLGRELSGPQKSHTVGICLIYIYIYIIYICIFHIPLGVTWPKAPGGDERRSCWHQSPRVARVGAEGTHRGLNEELAIWPLDG